MFDLDKLIKMVKKGEISRKHFNMRKKSWNEDDEYIRRNTDPSDTEEYYTEDFGEEGGEERQMNIAPLLTPEQKNQQALKQEKIQKEITQWVQQNAQNMSIESKEGVEALEEKRDENPEDSLLQVNRFIVEEILKDPQLISILSNEINQATQVGQYVSNVFIGTMLAKYKIEQGNIQGAPIDTPRLGVLPEEDGEDIMYDDITTSVMERFNPEALKRSGDWDSVLDALSPKGKDRGKGTGKMYDVGKFTEAVEKTFGVSSGGIDQRMNFFLTNSDLLMKPYFPEGNIFQKINGLEISLREALSKLGINNPDITEALRSVKDTTSTDAKSSSSPRRIITDLLKLYAEPELLEILQNLISEGDPSIVRWFKNKLPYVGNVSGPSIDADEEGRAIAPGIDKKTKEKIEKATPEQQAKAAGQTAAIINGYLDGQLEVIDMMKNSTVSNLIKSQADEYIELKSQLSTLHGVEREKIENDMKTKMKMYDIAEQLNGFSSYAINQLRNIFIEASAVSSGLKYVKPGSKQQKTMINYTNAFGKAAVPSDVVKSIFVGDEKNIKKNGHRNYVEDYIQKINSGEIENPYSPDWSKMVNRRVPYDAYADMFIIKTQIKNEYKAQAERQPVGSFYEEGVINSIYNNLNNFPQTKKMIENFSGVAPTDEPIKEETKKKNFIKMTIDQTDDDLKLYKGCYDARKKYNEQREAVKNNPKLSEAEKKEQIHYINILEKNGDFLGFKIDKNGNFINDRKGKPKVKRDYSMLKNVKGNIGSILWPILPSILDNIQNSKYDNIFLKNAEKAFIQLFDHQAKQYERYADIGKNVNPFDDRGRSNTELYYLVKEGRIPEEIQKIIDFTKKSKMTKDDKEYVIGLQKTFGLKKELRKWQDLLNAAINDKNVHVINRLLYKARKKIQQIQFEKDPNIRSKFLSNVPPDRLEEFETNINNWDGTSELPDEYYLWLGLKQAVNRKKTLEMPIKRYKKDVFKLQEKIVEQEKENAKLKRYTTASTNSYLRMVTAEYDRALLKIDRLYKIKRSSYKFASIDPVSIDDTILDIEKDFENLLDSLIE